MKEMSWTHVPHEHSISLVAISSQNLADKMMKEVEGIRCLNASEPVRERIKDVDKDHDGKLNEKEIAQFLADRNHLPADSLYNRVNAKASMRDLDKDGDHKVSVEEIFAGGNANKVSDHKKHYAIVMDNDKIYLPKIKLELHKQPTAFHLHQSVKYPDGSQCRSLPDLEII